MDYEAPAGIISYKGFLYLCRKFGVRAVLAMKTRLIVEFQTGVLHQGWTRGGLMATTQREVSA